MVSAVNSELGNNLSKGSDLARALAMIAIMLYHQYFTFNPLLDSFHYFGHWGVDVFFFLSGFCLYFSLERSRSASLFYRKRIVRIFPAAIIGGCLVYCWKESSAYTYIHDFNLPEPADAIMWCSGLHLWYIRSLLLMYLLAPLLFIVLKRDISIRHLILGALLYIPGVLGCMFIFLHVGHTVDFRLTETTLFWTLQRLPIFFGGMYTARLCERSECGRLSRGFRITALLFTLAALSIQVASMNSLIPRSTAWLQYPLLLPAIICFITFCAKMERYLPLLIKAGLHHIAAISLEIYVIHEAAYVFTKLNFCKGLPGLVCAFVFVIILASVIHFAIARGLYAFRRPLAAR